MNSTTKHLSLPPEKARFAKGDRDKGPVCPAYRPGGAGRRVTGTGRVVIKNKFLTEDELKRLKDVGKGGDEKGRQLGRKTPVRDWLVIDLALFTGLRVNEIRELKCGDIMMTDPEGFRGSLIIVRNGKGGKMRTVYFNGQLKIHLKEYLEWKSASNEGINSEDPLLLSARTGGLFSKRALQRVFERMAKMAGITGHCFHHLRHTYASHLYKASNYNLRLVQKQLGHASIKTTQVYADVFDEDLTKALQKLYTS
jgi:integrase